MADESNADKKQATDLRPVPDPTILTTAALIRETGALREILEVQIAADRAFFVQRFDDMDAARELTAKQMEQMPQERRILLSEIKVSFSEQITAQRDLMLSMFKLHDEKFRSVEEQFRERDVRVQGTAEQTKVAVDAALQAAEKAVGKQNDASAQSIAKSETMTVKQIDQLSVLISTTAKAADDKIVDLKDRVTRMESEDRGGRVSKDDSKANIHVVVAIGGAVFGLISIAVAIIALFLRSVGH